MLRLLSSVVLLSPALALAQQSSGSAFAATIGLQRDPRVERALADVSPQRIRATYAPTHERVISAGQETTMLLDVQLDDAWAAVRAVGAGGARSLATAISGPGT